MADSDIHQRAARDLSVPETEKIAAFLAELMPGGSPKATANLAPREPVAPAVSTKPAPSPAPPPEDSVPVFSPGKFAFEELDSEPPSVLIAPLTRSHSGERRITATVTPVAATKPQSAANIVLPPIPKAESKPPSVPSIELPPISKAEPKPQSAASIVLPPIPKAEPIAPRNLGDKAAGAVLGQYNWKNDPNHDKPPSRVQSPAAHAESPDTDLIPLGDLTLAGFFGLVNWRNDPARARHPRRQELNLDEGSLAAAKTIPFFIAGQPRVPDTVSVAAVLSQVAWE